MRLSIIEMKAAFFMVYTWHITENRWLYKPLTSNR